ncbi:MAG: HEAT repeat domain-containing protein [Planctomycetota bacterium]
MKAMIVIALAVLLGTVSAFGQSFQRHSVGDHGFSIEAPSGWKPSEARGSIQLLLREYPSRDVVAILSVQLHPKSSSLASWAADYTSRQVPTIYPGSRLQADDQLDVQGHRARRFHIVDLPGRYEKYAAFETLIELEHQLAFVSLHFDETRGEEYARIYDSLLETVETDESAVPSQVALDIFDSGRGTSLAVDQIEWIDSFEEAFEIAKNRGVPVLVAFNRDDEPACQHFADEIYHDPDIVALSRRAVCLIASTYDHAALPSGRPACSRFGSIDCADHRDVDIRARENLLEGSEVAIAPQHILCRPDGSILSRKEYQISKKALADMIVDAIRTVRKESKDAETGDFAALYARAEGTDDKTDIILEASHSLDSKAFEKLAAELTKSAQGEERIAVIEALTRTGHPAALDEIEKQLRDDSPKVRIAAARSLRRIGSDRSAKALQSALRSEKDEAAACQLILTLADCAPGDSSSASRILRELDAKETSRRLAAIMGLRQFPDNSRASRELLELLEDEKQPPETRVAAAWTLGFLEEAPARDAIAKLLETAPPDQAVIVQGALARIDGRFQGKYENLVQHFRPLLISPR